MALVYSCCFWFSLRLGGIIIGLLSILQGVLVLAGCSFAYDNYERVQNDFFELSNQYNLIYVKDYFDNFIQDPKKYASFTIAFTCLYILTCILYIYGAYICNNLLMFAYIVLELFRLFVILAVVATGLLLLKQNTMDIGFLIGASVVGGFFLLGMFYLWVCATNLPVLINEMERDDQAAAIAKLQLLLETSQKQTRRDGISKFPMSVDPHYSRNVFAITNKSKVSRHYQAL